MVRRRWWPRDWPAAGAVTAIPDMAADSIGRLAPAQPAAAERRDGHRYRFFPGRFTHYSAGTGSLRRDDQFRPTDRLGLRRGPQGRSLRLDPAYLRSRRDGLARISVGGLVCRPAAPRGLHRRGRLRRHAHRLLPPIGRTAPGPTIGMYAEYDAVPGNCQDAATVEAPAPGLEPACRRPYRSAFRASASAASAGCSPARRRCSATASRARLRFTGEPAEKVRGSKPIHAAKGYYDGLAGMISFHPFYMLPLCNTARWDTHCGAAYAMIYRFICDEPESWARAAAMARPSRRRIRRCARPAPMTR